MTHRIVLVVSAGFELLDASGPASVFASANHVLAEHGERPFHAVEPVSASGGPVASNSGVTVQTRTLLEVRPWANPSYVEDCRAW